MSILHNLHAVSDYCDWIHLLRLLNKITIITTKNYSSKLTKTKTKMTVTKIKCHCGRMDIMAHQSSWVAPAI